MSHDWLAPTALLLSVPLAIGHLYHFILAVNVSSGWGVREHVAHQIRLALLAILMGSCLLMASESLDGPWWNWSWPLQGYAWICVFSCLVVLPASSIRIAWRRRRAPRGMVSRTRTVDFEADHSRENFIGTGWNARLLRFPGNEAFRLNLVDWEVTIPGLPPSLEGLRILQISDLHFARCFRRSYFETVVGACRDWESDLVLFTGDLVDDDRAIEWIEPVLGGLEAELGKFAILGNHDGEHNPPVILEALARAGYEALEGRWTTLPIGEATLAIGGTSAPWGPLFDPAEIPEADFRLLLSHSPDQFYRAQRWGVDLMLSGHNHGGQIRLPLIGPVFMPSQYSRRFDRGFFRSGSTLLFVTEGVAGKHPIRYGCPPEVCRLVLRAPSTHSHRTAGTSALLSERVRASRSGTL
jgi:predicted MPP superfamily phosphohydrolase